MADGALNHFLVAAERRHAAGGAAPAPAPAPAPAEAPAEAPVEALVDTSVETPVETPAEAPAIDVTATLADPGSPADDGFEGLTGAQLLQAGDNVWNDKPKSKSSMTNMQTGTGLAALTKAERIKQGYARGANVGNQPNEYLSRHGRKRRYVDPTTLQVVKVKVGCAGGGILPPFDVREQMLRFFLNAGVYRDSEGLRASRAHFAMPPAALDAPYRSNGRAPTVSATPPASIGPGFGRSEPENGDGPAPFALPPPP